MGQQNVLGDGAQVASFTPLGGDAISVHQQLQRITDSRGPRVVVHEFPNRDGAKIETLGRKPHRTQWALTYTGATWRDDLLKLVKAIDQSPAGLLIHPIYGRMNVVCLGFDRSVVDIPDAVDTVTLELGFVEDQQDLGLDAQQGLAAKQQAATSASSDFKAAAAVYIGAAAVSAVSAAVAASSSYVAAAFDAASTNVVDPSLGAQLDAVATSLAAAQAAILADPAGLGTMATYDALAAADVLYAACLDLADEVALETSGFTIYTAQGGTSIAVILQAVYGPRAISVFDQTLQLNPTLLDPTNVPPGFQLVLPP